MKMKNRCSGVIKNYWKWFSQEPVGKHGNVGRNAFNYAHFKVIVELNGLG